MSAQILQFKIPGALRVVARQTGYAVLWLATPASEPQEIIFTPYDDVAAWFAREMANEHGFRVLPMVSA